MASYDYDLFVIGAGSGGVRAARMSANYGARVAVAEDRDLGGTCVNVGCVPKKLFVYGSHYSEDVQDAAAYGWDMANNGFDWPTLKGNKNTEIARLNGIYAKLLDGAGVETIRARATLVDDHTVDLEGRKVTAERILVATGSWPTVPEFPGSEHVITSNEAFHLETFPETVVVVGGGYIAVEFAGIFHGLGAKTTLLYRRDLFLRGFDLGVREFVRDQLDETGINLRFNANPARVDKVGSGYRVTLEDGSTLDADLVMYATGRHPKVDGLGLGHVGVEQRDSGAVVVDEHFQTSVPSVYALGDVIDRMQLTPVAITEAMALSAHLYKGGEGTVDYADIPTAVFCQPNIGTVGLTEEQAVEAHGSIDVYESTFRPMKHTLTGRGERTLMKLLVNRADDRVVGAHMVGPDAGEITQGLGIALKCGATKAQFDATVGIHPTAAEEFVTMREVARSY